MITYRPGLPTLYEHPDVDPELAFVNTAQPTELLPTPAPQELIDPVAAAIAAADARDPGGPKVSPPVDVIAAVQESASAPAGSQDLPGPPAEAPSESAAPVAAPVEPEVEHFVKPFEAPATAPFPADVQPAAAADALLQ